MKKKLILMLTLIFILGLSACSKDEPKKDTPTQAPTQTVTEAPTSEPVNTVVTDVVTPTEEPVEVTPTECVDTNNEILIMPDEEQSLYENGKVKEGVVPIADENGYVSYYDEEGNLLYAQPTPEPTPIPCEDLEITDNDYLEMATGWLESIQLDNNLETDTPFWTKEDLRKQLIEYAIPDDIIEQVLAKYPLSDKEQADRLIEWSKYRGDGAERVKELFTENNISLEYFDEEAYMQDNSLVITAVQNLQEALFAITKQNLYDILIEQGYSDTDVRNALESAYIVRTDEELTNIYKSEGASQTDINAALERYHNELTLK